MTPTGEIGDVLLEFGDGVNWGATEVLSSGISGNGEVEGAWKELGPRFPTPLALWNEKNGLWWWCVGGENTEGPTSVAPGDALMYPWSTETLELAELWRIRLSLLQKSVKNWRSSVLELVHEHYMGKSDIVIWSVELKKSLFISHDDSDPF